MAEDCETTDDWLVGPESVVDTDVGGGAESLVTVAPVEPEVVVCNTLEKTEPGRP